MSHFSFLSRVKTRLKTLEAYHSAVINLERARFVVLFCQRVFDSLAFEGPGARETSQARGNDQRGNFLFLTLEKGRRLAGIFYCQSKSGGIEDPDIATGDLLLVARPGLLSSKGKGDREASFFFWLGGSSFVCP